MNTKRLNFPLLAILMLALVLRLVSLADHSLWYDEAFAVLFAEKGLDAMLYGTLTPVEGGASDIHPLLYYMTLNFWMQVFGQSPFAVRLWSVILGMVSIGLMSAVGRTLFSQRTGLAAALITAVAPFHVHYSQETRMYTLMAVLLLGATWCYLRATRDPETGEQAQKKPPIAWKWWIGFGILAGLAMYTQQLSAFHLMALGLLPLTTRNRSHLPGMAAGTGVALIVYLPWLVNIPSQLEKVNSYYWIQAPGIGKLITTLYIFLTNYAEIPMPYALVGLAGAVILCMLLLAQILLYRQRTRRHKQSDFNLVLFVAWLFGAPIVLMWLVSQVQPVFLERGLITSALMLYLLLAWMFTRSGLPRILQILLGVIGLGLVLIGLVSQYTLNTFPYSPHHEMIEYIESQWKEGDTIIHMNKLSALPGVYYGRNLWQRYLGDLPGSSEDTLAVPTQEALQLLANRCMAEAADGARRVWFVTLARAEQEYAVSERTELRDATDWLEEHYTLNRTLHFNDLNLYLYTNGENNPTDCSE